MLFSRTQLRNVATVAMMWAASAAALARAVHTPEPVVPASPDHELSAIYSAIDQGHLDEALTLDDALIARLPNFRLALLIRGDLLMAHAGPIVGFGDITGAPQDRVSDLREEALVRLRAYRDKPAANMVPRYLLELPPDQKSAVVIDAQRSRLFLYANVNGKPHYVADYYITQGKLGADKSAEGDMKTPVGVYHITGSLSRKRLNDFYGAGALPINYPNEFDRLVGHTGHGIWLHGTPSDTFSRPPKASDGCVVLSNQDWRALFQSVQLGVTPVIIADNIEWQSVGDWTNERSGLQHAIEAWRTDWESRDINLYLSHYSKRFASDTEAIRQWSTRKRHVNATKEWVKVQVKDLSMLRYPGQGDMVVVTFEQDYHSNDLATVGKKRQYWVKENNRWKIIYEGIA